MKRVHQNSTGTNYALREEKTQSPWVPTTVGTALVAARFTGLPLLRAFILRTFVSTPKMELELTGRLHMKTSSHTMNCLKKKCLFLARPTTPGVIPMAILMVL